MNNDASDRLIPPKTPRLEKLRATQANSQIIGEFLEWLKTNYASKEVGFINIEESLLEFYSIDSEALKRERREIMTYQQSLATNNDRGKKIC